MTYYGKELNDGKHIFVFGSNLKGRHGIGAAAVAARDWGAQEGVGRGRTGNAYAIPTKDHSLFVRSVGAIAIEVDGLRRYALANPHLTFLVTAIGTGYAKYEHETMIPLFDMLPPNCQLPYEWRATIERHRNLPNRLRDAKPS